VTAVDLFTPDELSEFFLACPKTRLFVRQRCSTVFHLEVLMRLRFLNRLWELSLLMSVLMAFSIFSAKFCLFSRICITSSSNPSIWKAAVVLPLPKIIVLSDFRTLSILPVFSKGVERRFYSYLELNSLSQFW
jgi:hypothetical protein